MSRNLAIRSTSSMIAIATLAACLAASPSLAQTTAADQAADATATDPTDIVVTAQRRSERLTDVPVSVTALSGDAIKASGITDTYSLQQVSPGLRMERLGGYTQPSIRGVTAGSTSPGSEANVAIYVDGIYQPNQAANTIDLPDVARVEVSKGPQGTLFGRNATGGAIQIFTRAPSFTTTGGISATAGYYDGSGPSRSSYDLGLKGFLSGPIVPDKVAASLSFGYRNVDGYSTNIVQKLLPAPIQKAYGSDRMDWLKSLSDRKSVV